MKRSSVLIALAIICAGVSYLASCSDPLEINNSSPNPGPGRVDTFYIFDTLTPPDTAVRVDTIRITDTVIVTDTVTMQDTVTRIDSVIIIDSANCRPQPICGRISSYEKDIFWMFRNAAGAYHLEFSGSTESDKPLQTLLVTIDGTTFEWKAGENPLWVKDLTLGANAIISISLTNPGAYGHDIDVCLNMTPQ